MIDSLKSNKPVLVGHSIGGEELSSVGSRHPEKVAGLIYLDAGYSYAYYDRARGDFSVDLVELQRKLDQLLPGKGPADSRPIIRELLETRLRPSKRNCRSRKSSSTRRPPHCSLPQAAAPTPTAVRPSSRASRSTPISTCRFSRYTRSRTIQVRPSVAMPPKRAAFEARDEVTTGAQAKAFETGLPSAHVVRLPHANHYVFLSNESDVLREMNCVPCQFASVILLRHHS